MAERLGVKSRLGTPPAPKQPLSPWPMPLMLDELWLRSRRVVTETLIARDLWPTDEDFARIIALERDRGRRIGKELLPRVLGKETALALTAGTLLGPSGGLVARQLPLILAFGSMLGGGRAELGAAFNLGISMLDCYVDDRGGHGTLSRHLSPELIRAAVSGEVTASPSITGGSSSEDSDLKLVLALADYFLTEVRGLCDTEPTLLGHIEGALSAELASLSTDAPAHVAQEKSTRPFAILAMLAGDPVEDGRDLGQAFWLIDDLVDVVADLRDGATNTFIGGGGGDPSEAVADLLWGHRLEQAAADAASALEAVTSRWRAAGDAERARAVCCYARDWVR